MLRHLEAGGSLHPEAANESDLEPPQVLEPRHFKMTKVQKDAEREDALHYFANGTMGASRPSSSADEPCTLETTPEGIAWVKPVSYRELLPHETLSKKGLRFRQNKP